MRSTHFRTLVAAVIVLATASVTYACGGGYRSSSYYRPRTVVIVQPQVVPLPVAQPAPIAPPVAVAPAPGPMDLALVSVRLVDNGNPAQNLGPRFRVWIRNSGPAPLYQPFGVMLLAARDATATPDLPQAAVQIASLQPGQVLPIDIRLPAEANQSGLPMIHALVDARREVFEQNKANNVAVLDRSTIAPVDPTLFSTDAPSAAVGTEIGMVGEGLGPGNGHAIVKLGGLDLEAEITGWTEQGARIRLPALPLANPTPAQVLLVRADGKPANAMALTVTPVASNVAAAPPMAAGFQSIMQMASAPAAN